MRNSFGLTSEHKEDILLEPFFILTYYAGMDWETYYHFPVVYKRWLIKRINDEIKRAVEGKSDTPTKAAHHNSPDLRAMTGKTKHFGQNGKTQRFT